MGAKKYKIEYHSSYEDKDRYEVAKSSFIQNHIKHKYVYVYCNDIVDSKGKVYRIREQQDSTNRSY